MNNSRKRKQEPLTTREIRILKVLHQAHPEPIDVKAILRDGLGYTFDPNTNVANVALCRLRRKLVKLKDVSVTTGYEGYSLILTGSFRDADTDAFIQKLEMEWDL